MTSRIDDALRVFAATEANLMKIERLWDEIAKLIPDGIRFACSTPDAATYENDCLAFRSILPHVPALDGFRITDELLDLDDIAQMRMDAHEVNDIECALTIERQIASQGPIIRKYRFKFNRARRELVRSAVIDRLAEIGAHSETLRAALPEIGDGPVDHPAWDALKASVRQLGILLGNSFTRPARWADLHRHLHFGLRCDLVDVLNNDWPAINSSVSQALYANDDPTPVVVEDLGNLVTGQPSGSVAIGLRWESLRPEDFERLVFCLIGDASGYEDPQWLTRTCAQDRGRDLSVSRVHDDSLAETQRARVIIQCKHWLSKSVGPQEVAHAREQMKLWEPPSVDVLIVATSGRFTIDAVRLIERHNTERALPRIEMWPDSHLERLLAERPHIVAEFDLR